MVLHSWAPISFYYLFTPSSAFFVFDLHYENPMDGGACRLESMGSQRVRHDWATSLHFTSYKLIPICDHYCVFVGVCVCIHMSSRIWLLATSWIQPVWLLCSWTSPSKNTGEGCHSLLQGIYPTQGLNLHLWLLLHWQVDSLPLCHFGISLLIHYFNCKYLLSLYYGPSGFLSLSLVTKH